MSPGRSAPRACRDQRLRRDSGAGGGAVRALGCPIFEVSPIENKLALVGDKTASKDTMIRAAHAIYPEANWLTDKKGKLLNKNEHLADAIGAIHAGVNLPAFQNLIKLIKA